jgi:hypothetical protein
MSLQSRFQDLDRFLTNKCKPLDDYPEDAREAMGDSVVYLSDGGYSRLYGQFDQSDLFGYTLGSESREEVRNRLQMPEGKLMLESICTTINTQIQEMEE